MGVRGLWDILSPVQEYRPLAMIGGETVAVDLSIWICGDKSISTLQSIHLRNLFFRILNLLRQNTLPVPVLDGCAPSLKAKVMEQRKHKKFIKTDLPSSKNVNLQRPQFSKVSAGCTQLLNALGVPWVQSPGEAEAMCAFLNSNKIVDACITNDGDVFLYGAEKVYRHFSMDSRDSSVRVYHSEIIKKVLNLTQFDLVLIGLLLGCDYWPNRVSRLGSVGAMRLIECLKSFDQLTSLQFLSWLIKKSPQSVKDFSNNLVGCQITDQNLIKLWIQVGKDLQNCPIKEIFHEFLSDHVGKKWNLPKRESFIQWHRPDPRAVINFCQTQLAWNPAYVLNHLLPILAIWDLRHPQIYDNLSLSVQYKIDDALILKPLRIIKKRVVNFVESFEVEWNRLGFDIWTERSNYDTNKNHLTENEHDNNKNFVNNKENFVSTYRFTVPAIEFRNVHPQIYDTFKSSKEKSKFKNSKKVKCNAKMDKPSQISLDKVFERLLISDKFTENNKIKNIQKDQSSVIKKIPNWDSDSDTDSSFDELNELSSPLNFKMNDSICGYKSDSELFNKSSQNLLPTTSVRSMKSPLTNLKLVFNKCETVSFLFDSSKHHLLLQSSLLSNSTSSISPNNNNNSHISFTKNSLQSSPDKLLFSPFGYYKTPKSLRERLGIPNL